MDNNTLIDIYTQIAKLTERVDNISRMFYFVGGGIVLQIIATVWGKINKNGNGNGNGSGKNCRTLREEDYQILQELKNISAKLSIDKTEQKGKIVAYFDDPKNIGGSNG